MTTSCSKCTFPWCIYLSGQQRVGIEAFHAADQLIPGVDHVVHKAAVKQEPIGAAVHRNPFWDFSVPESPHVSVALIKESVQTLFTDEPETME